MPALPSSFLVAHTVTSQLHGLQARVQCNTHDAIECMSGKPNY